ncbi:MAG TPA: glycoside hydrolase family 5 protein [Cellvibrionaceae bacterium]
MFDGVVDSIAGPSLFWSTNGWGGEKYYNADAVAWVKEQWGAMLIRAAMGAQREAGHYIQQPEDNRNKVITVVDAAIASDMYVIIDWHSHHAEEHQQQAVDFFTEMATLYGEYDNVIYEIYNEPLNTTSWSNTIKPYAEAVIAAIRAVDPDNLIIVGTPTWSQDVDVASNDPITGFDNIAYALHFYAGTHTQFLRDKASTAMNNGIALFATEWGTVNANGDGDVALEETLEWMAFFKDNQISHANWALNDKDEGASVLKPGASVSGGWSDNDLTESGLLVRDIILNW